MGVLVFVGNVSNMSASVAMTPQCCLELSWHHHVANIVTGFMAGSRVGWRVTTWLPSHIHDLCGHYSDRGNGCFIFKKKIVRLNELTHTISFSKHSCTKSHHFCMSLCKALLFFLYVEKHQPTCLLLSSWHNMSCHLAWSRWQNLTKCWVNIPDIFP